MAELEECTPVVTSRQLSDYCILHVASVLLVPRPNLGAIVSLYEHMHMTESSADLNHILCIQNNL